MKVQPEWFAGGLGGSLQKAYDVSLDGSILLDDTRGSFDIRGPVDTWDAPILTAGFTGLAPNTVVTALGGKLVAEESSVTNSPGSFIVAGFSGVIENFSSNTQIIGGAEVRATDVSVNSAIINSNRVLLKRTDRSLVLASTGSLPGDIPIAYVPQVPARTYIYDNDYNSDGTYEPDKLLRIPIPGYDGTSSLEGLEDFDNSITAYPIATHRVVVSGSNRFRTVMTETSSILSSSDVFMQGTTGSGWDSGLGQTVNKYFPVRNASVYGSNEVFVGGQSSNVSVNSSGGVQVSGLVPDLGGTYYVAVSGSREVLVSNSVAVHVGGSSNVSITEGQYQVGNPSAVDKSYFVSVGGSVDVVIKVADKVGVLGSSYVTIGKLSDESNTASKVLNSAVVGSSKIKMDRTNNSVISSSTESSIEVGVDTGGAYQSNLTASSFAKILGGVGSSVQSSDYTRVEDSYRSAIVASSKSYYAAESYLKACANTVIEASAGVSAKKAFRTSISSSIDIDVDAGAFGSGSTNSSISAAVTSSFISIQKSSVSAVMQSSLEEITHSALLSVKNSVVKKLDGSFVAGVHNLKAGYKPSGYDIEYLLELCSNRANIDSIIAAADTYSSDTYYSNDCVVLASTDSVFFSNTGCALIGGSDINMSLHNHRSAAIGGEHNTMIFSDRAALLGGGGLDMGPWCHGTVVGGGSNTKFVEVSNSVGLGNQESEFLQEEMSVYLGNYESKSNNSLHTVFLGSDRAEVSVSVEATSISSEDVTLANVFRSGAIMSAAVGMRGTTYAHAISSSTLDVENSHHVEISASDSTMVLDSSRVSVIASWDHTVDGSEGIAIHGAITSSVVDSAQSSILSSQAISFVRADRVSVDSSESVTIQDSNTVKVSSSHSSSIADHSHYAHISSSKGVEIKESLYFSAHSNDGVYVSKFSHYSSSSNSNSGYIRNSSYSSLRNTTYSQINSGNIYTSIQNAIYSDVRGSEFSNVMSVRSASVESDQFTTVQASKSSSSKSNNATTLSASEGSHLKNSNRSALVATSGSEATNLVSSTITGSEGVIANNVASILVGGSGGVEMGKCYQAAVLGLGGSITLRGASIAAITSSTSVVAVRASKVLVASSYDVGVYNSDNIAIESSQSATISGKSVWSAIRTSEGASIIGSFKTSIQDSIGYSSSSYAGVRSVGSAQTTINSSAPFTEVVNSRNVSHSSGSSNTVSNAEFSTIEASYGSFVEYVNNVYVGASSFVTVKESSHNSSVLSSYNTTVSGQSVNISVSGASNSSVSDRSHSSSLNSVDNTHISGDTIRAGVRNSERVTIGGQSHRTVVDSSRGVVVGGHSEGSLVAASEDAVMVNASRNSALIATRNAVMTGSEKAVQIASEDSTTIDAPNSAIIASNGAKATHQSEVARANGYYGNVGEAQTSNFLLRTLVGEDDQELFLDGVTGPDGSRVNLDTNSTYSVKASIVAKGDTGGVGAVRNFEGILTTDDNYIYTDMVNESYTGCSSDLLMLNTSVDIGATGLLLTVEAQGAAGTPYAGMQSRWFADITLTKVSY